MDEFGNRTVMSTEHLTIDPGREKMATDAVVRMDSPNLEQTAIGMEASLEDDLITFLRNVQGVYFVRPN